MVASLLTIMNTIARIVLCVGMFFYGAFLAQAEEESHFAAPSSKEREFRSLHDSVFEEDLPAEEPLYDFPGEDQPDASEEETHTPEDWSPPFPSEEEFSSPFLEQRGSSGFALPPGEIPPFMSRPLEWEATPPTVIGMPPLPAASSFSDHELIAFTFIEKGKDHFDREEWELAQEQFERAISIAPFLPYSYYFLGRMAFHHGDLKGALAFLQKAELLFPRTNRAWLGETTSIKGTVYEELNDYEEARAAYRRSLHFQPANLKVLSALARLPEEEPTASDAIFQ